jgi:hypothetical protein
MLTKDEVWSWIPPLFPAVHSYQKIAIFVYIVAERTRELFIQKIPQIVRVENLRN